MVETENVRQNNGVGNVRSCKEKVTEGSRWELKHSGTKKGSKMGKKKSGTK